MTLYPSARKAISTAARAAKDAWSGLLDLVYPPFCLMCGRAGEHCLCPKCMDEVVMIEPPVCFRCGLPKDSSSCPDCRDREFAFRRAAGAGVFDGVLREAIHGLKYRSQIALADPLAEVMARGYAGTGLAGAAEVAVPIPIHHSRKLDRGFNQAEELALRFCRRVGLPLETGALIKHRETKHQVNLPHELRAKNVEGAFRVRDARPVMRKRILLIDDVFTTGSTLNEAAKVLKESGSGEVYAYTLARSL